MACATSRASATERFRSRTKSESVSPYTTLASHCGCSSTSRLALTSVARPDATMASASSAIGILPENDADVYPYVTLATFFSASCRASSTRWSTVSPRCRARFIERFT